MDGRHLDGQPLLDGRRDHFNRLICQNWQAFSSILRHAGCQRNYANAPAACFRTACRRYFANSDRAAGPGRNSGKVTSWRFTREVCEGRTGLIRVSQFSRLSGAFDDGNLAQSDAALLASRGRGRGQGNVLGVRPPRSDTRRDRWLHRISMTNRSCPSSTWVLVVVYRKPKRTGRIDSFCDAAEIDRPDSGRRLRPVRQQRSWGCSLRAAAT